MLLQQEDACLRFQKYKNQLKRKMAGPGVTHMKDSIALAGRNTGNQTEVLCMKFRELCGKDIMVILYGLQAQAARRGGVNQQTGAWAAGLQACAGVHRGRAKSSYGSRGRWSAVKSTQRVENLSLLQFLRCCQEAVEDGAYFVD